MNKILVFSAITAFSLNTLAAELSQVGQANYFVLHNLTDNELQVKSTTTDGKSLDVTLPVNGYTPLYGVDMTSTLTVKKIGKNPLHREHRVDLEKAQELYMDDAFSTKPGSGTRGVKVKVKNKLVGVDIEIVYDK